MNFVQQIGVVFQALAVAAAQTRVASEPVVVLFDAVDDEGLALLRIEDRVMPRTRWPRAMSARAMAPPWFPVAPVTRTVSALVMSDSPFGAADLGVASLSVARHGHGFKSKRNPTFRLPAGLDRSVESAGPSPTAAVCGGKEGADAHRPILAPARPELRRRR